MAMGLLLPAHGCGDDDVVDAGMDSGLVESDGGVSCEAVELDVSSIADSLAFDARGECSVDSDCLWASTATSCSDGRALDVCPRLVLGSNASTFTTAWEEAARTACENTACDLELDCISPPAARCVEGRCRL